ncbi:hypothetical protein LINPERPRIM_LOCUS18087 [Linum perenne]
MNCVLVVLIWFVHIHQAVVALCTLQLLHQLFPLSHA